MLRTFKYFAHTLPEKKINRSLGATFFCALFLALAVISFGNQAAAQNSKTGKSGFEIEFSGSVGGVGGGGKDVEKEKRLMVSRAIRTRKVLSLISIISFVEKKTGAQILDASLITPNPFNYRSWYYVIKQRSRSGRVSVKKYAAKNGQEIK